MTRRTSTRRLVTLFGGLGLVLATAFYLPITLLAPLEPIAPTLIAVTAPENPPVELAWPDTGGAAIGAVGYPGVLAESSDTSPRSIASITKVITTLVVLEKMPLALGESGPTITMTQQDVNGYHWQIAHNGSASRVAAGVNLTQRELLNVVLIASANNYAETMARWAFGSEEEFLSAARIWLDDHGLSGVQMFDASGIDPRNTATPAEMVELGKIAMASPIVSEIVSTKSAHVPYVGNIENTNTLLGWNGVEGIKTGTVTRNNRCLLFTTTVTVGPQSIELVGVVLGSPSYPALEAAVKELITSAMDGFHEVPLVGAGDSFGSYHSEWGDNTTAVASSSASVVVWGGTPITLSVRIDPIVTGVVGQHVGTVTYTVDGKATTVPLTLDDPLEDPGPWWRLTHPFG